jgi:hypothetical protein
MEEFLSDLLGTFRTRIITEIEVFSDKGKAVRTLLRLRPEYLALARHQVGNISVVVEQFVRVLTERTRLSTDELVPMFRQLSRVAPNTWDDAMRAIFHQNLWGQVIDPTSWVKMSSKQRLNRVVSRVINRLPVQLAPDAGDVLVMHVLFGTFVGQASISSDQFYESEGVITPRLLTFDVTSMADICIYDSCDVRPVGNFVSFKHTKTTSGADLPSVSVFVEVCRSKVSLELFAGIALELRLLSFLAETFFDDMGVYGGSSTFIFRLVTLPAPVQQRTESFVEWLIASGIMCISKEELSRRLLKVVDDLRRLSSVQFDMVAKSASVSDQGVYLALLQAREKQNFHNIPWATLSACVSRMIGTMTDGYLRIGLKFSDVSVFSGLNWPSWQDAVKAHLCAADSFYGTAAMVVAPYGAFLTVPDKVVLSTTDSVLWRTVNPFVCCETQQLRSKVYNRPGHLMPQLPDVFSIQPGNLPTPVPIGRPVMLANSVSVFRPLSQQFATVRDLVRESFGFVINPSTGLHFTDASAEDDIVEAVDRSLVLFDNDILVFGSYVPVFSANRGQATINLRKFILNL